MDLCEGQMEKAKIAYCTNCDYAMTLSERKYIRFPECPRCGKSGFKPVLKLVGGTDEDRRIPSKSCR